MGLSAVQLCRDLDVQYKTAFVLMHKLREAEGVSFAKEKIVPGSTISADEIAHWGLLEAEFDVNRINRSDAYSHNGVIPTWRRAFLLGFGV